LSINIISATGWRGVFKICGGLGVIFAVFGIIILREPPREKNAEEELEADLSYIF
jgi:predicted MFS family arabinose efflux permease